MVDVTLKAETDRVAIASAEIAMSKSTLSAIRARRVPKGDVLEVSRVAGLMAVKRTPEILPLCHPIRITGAEIEVTTKRRGVHVVAVVRAHDRTGVEMEALTAVCAAALCVYDMLKAIDRGIVIGPIRLLEKSGGRSGLWRRQGVTNSHK